EGMRIISIDPHVAETPVHRHAMQSDEVGPEQLSGLNSIHILHIQAAPRIRHLLPVGLDAMKGTESPALESYAGAPVDDRSEDVKRQRTKVAEVTHSPSSSTEL